MNFVIHKYNDSTFTEEWFEPYDGKWPFGDEKEHVVIHDYNFYEK